MKKRKSEIPILSLKFKNSLKVVKKTSEQIVFLSTTQLLNSLETLALSFKQSGYPGTFLQTVCKPWHFPLNSPETLALLFKQFGNPGTFLKQSGNPGTFL